MVFESIEFMIIQKYRLYRIILHARCKEGQPRLFDDIASVATGTATLAEMTSLIHVKAVRNRNFGTCRGSACGCGCT